MALISSGLAVFQNISSDGDRNHLMNVSVINRASSLILSPICSWTHIGCAIAGMPLTQDAGL